MTFQPGMSGNPDGARKYREASEMLRAAVNSPVTKGAHKGKARLRRICDRIASKAMAGEPWACCLVFDRLDGKAHQSVDASVTLEAGQVFVDLMRALNDARNTRTIEHKASAHKPTANGHNGASHPDVAPALPSPVTSQA